MRKFVLATDGAALQVLENEMSYLELLSAFAMLSEAIQSGKAGIPMPVLQVPLKPAEEVQEEKKD